MVNGRNETKGDSGFRGQVVCRKMSKYNIRQSTTKMMRRLSTVPFSLKEGEINARVENNI